MASARAQGRPIARIAPVGAIVAAGAAVAALSLTPSRAQEPSISAVVVKAVHACFASSVRFTGLVVPRAEAVVNFNIQGYQISDVLVKEGETVTSGQVLVKLSRLAGSASAAGPAQPASGASRPQPASLDLTAPAAGLLSASSAKIGEVAAAVPLPPPMGTGPLFRIIVDDKLEVEAEVPSIQLPKVDAGQLARIRLDNGREVAGKVRTVLPEIDRKTQFGKVRIAIDGDPAIRAGMFATGTIDASHSCGVSIPRAAVQYQTEGTTVQVVRDGTVETRRVHLGFSSASAFEVLDGVKEGELIIANAGTALHDGDQVRPILSDASGQAEAQ